MRLYHVRGVKAQNGYFVALHGEVQRIGNAAAHDGQVDFRILGTAQPLHDVFGTHFYSGNGCVVNCCDTVAGQYTYFFRGATAYGLNDEQGVFYHLELYPDSFEVALQGLVHFLHFFGVTVGRVWVELLKHPDDGLFYQLVFVYRVDVELADGKFGHLQFA